MIFTTPSSNDLWIDADQAEEGCHLGPESRAFMADMQYPVYGIILNIIPNTYPAIVGFLVVAALHERIFTRGRTSALPDEPTKRLPAGFWVGSSATTSVLVFAAIITTAGINTSRELLMRIDYLSTILKTNMDIVVLTVLASANIGGIDRR